MRTVTCYECRKKYSYDDDGFCPRCGSFNQPRKGSYTVSANGDIVRVDGINEAAHRDSFVHAEYHAEERERKQLGLDKEHPKPPRRAAATAAPVARTALQQRKKENAGVTGMIVWVIIIMVFLFNLVLETM